MPSSKEVVTDESPNKTIALTTATVLFGGTLALVAPFVVLSSTKSRPFSPYIATPSRKLHRAFAFISSFSKQRNRKFLDLGSGDGESVYQAVRQRNGGMPAPLIARAVGVELNSTLYLLSQIRRFFWKRDERIRSTFYCRDMWKFQQELSQYDTIFVSQIPAVQTRLGQMIAKECQPGTLLLSYRFHGMMDAVAELRAELVYDDNENMRIYQVLLPPPRSTEYDDRIEESNSEAVDSEVKQGLR